MTNYPVIPDIDKLSFLEKYEYGCWNNVWTLSKNRDRFLQGWDIRILIDNYGFRENNRRFVIFSGGVRNRTLCFGQLYKLLLDKKDKKIYLDNLNILNNENMPEIDLSSWKK